MKPKRIQLSRKKGWKMPSNTMKVDRTTQFGNPFRIGHTYGAVFGLPKVGLIGDAANAILVYMEYRERHPLTANEVAMLAGKNLACWCKPGTPCHADVLLEMANQ